MSTTRTQRRISTDEVLITETTVTESIYKISEKRADLERKNQVFADFQETQASQKLSWENDLANLTNQIEEAEELEIEPLES